MDSLPIPAWDLIDFPAYSDHVAREFSLHYLEIYHMLDFILLEDALYLLILPSSKIAGHKVRQSAKRVLDELEFITKTFGIKSFMNSDDNFLATGKETLREFLHG